MVARCKVALLVRTSWVVSEYLISEADPLEPIAPVHLVDRGERGKGVSNGDLSSGLNVILRSLKLLMIEPTLSESFFDELKGEERFTTTHTEALDQLQGAVREETLTLREAPGELVHDLGTGL